MSTFFPRSSRRLKEDGFQYLKTFIGIYGYTGKKVIIWHMILLFKMACYILRTVSVIEGIINHEFITGTLATYPIPLLTLCKLISLYVDRERVEFFYKTVENDFWDISLASEKIQKKIRRRCRIVNTLNSAYIITCFLICVFYICSPFIEIKEGDRRLPNRIWFPISTNPSPLHEILFFTLVINTYVSVIGIMVFDSIFIYFSQHLIIQFLLLSDRLENLDCGLTGDIEKYESDFFQRTIMGRIRLCAKHHETLLNFGKNLEMFTYFVLIPQLCISMASIVSSGFLLLSEQSEPFQAAVIFCISSVSLIDLSIFALIGTDLNDTASSVKFGTYCSKWYLFKPMARKELCIVMMNADIQELQITAGAMQTINNEVIVTVAQRSWSAILLLRAMLLDN